MLSASSKQPMPCFDACCCHSHTHIDQRQKSDFRIFFLVTSKEQLGADICLVPVFTQCCIYDVTMTILLYSVELASV